MKLPEYVRVCGFCEGTGEYKQMYTAGCGGGYYHSMGPCDNCQQEGKSSYHNGAGYVYKGDTRVRYKGVPDSVLNQIKRMNQGLVEE
jgi:hypothetical protein